MKKPDFTIMRALFTLLFMLSLLLVLSACTSTASPSAATTATAGATTPATVKPASTPASSAASPVVTPSASASALPSASASPGPSATPSASGGPSPAASASASAAAVPTGSPGATVTATTTGTASPSYSVLIVSSVTLGDYLADGKGMTLYYTTKNSTGVSNITGDTLNNWPVFYAPTIIVPQLLKTSDFGTITRSDGKMQTTFKGYPLYYYINDKVSGDIKGQGLAGIWYIINPGNFPPTPSASGSASPAGSPTP